MKNFLRRIIGTDRIIEDVEKRGEIPASVVETEQKLNDARARVNQSFQRIESKDRVFEAYAGKMRIMRGDIG